MRLFYFFLTSQIYFWVSFVSLLILSWSLFITRTMEMNSFDIKYWPSSSSSFLSTREDFHVYTHQCCGPIIAIAFHFIHSHISLFVFVLLLLFCKLSLVSYFFSFMISLYVYVLIVFLILKSSCKWRKYECILCFIFI